jgi:homoserine kinase
MARSLSVYAPASIGNLSVGFDALGLALAPVDGALLGDRVQLRALAEEPGAADWKLELEGPFWDALPANQEENVVIACCWAYQDAAAQKGVEVTPLNVLLDKQLPIGSGLGSSASSIVAALQALNLWHDQLLSSRELFRLMAQLEGGISGDIHLDNIAPCLFGGLRLCPPGGLHEHPLPWPGAWHAVVCWPGTRLVTREARAVLPAEIPRKTAVHHAAQFAEFVHALHTGNAKLAAECVVDHIAEPYRRSLLPGFDEAKVALTGMGAQAVGISGSGPTVFSLVDDLAVASNVAEWLGRNYSRNDKGFVHVCRADLVGARKIE